MNRIENRRVFVIGASVTAPYQSQPDFVVTSAQELNSVVFNPNDSLIGVMPEERHDTSPNKEAILGAFFPASYIDLVTFSTQFKKLLPDVPWNNTRLRSPEEAIAVITSLKALEDAGITPDLFEESTPWLPKGELNTKPLSIAVGVTNSVGPVKHIANAMEEMNRRTAFTVTRAGISGHTNVAILETLNTQGPAILNQAACATTLFNINSAETSLRSGDADLAIVGGLELISDPFWGNVLNFTGALAPYDQYKDDPTQASRPGDINPAGLVFTEGCAVIVLATTVTIQRLNIPQENILAELISSAVGQDPSRLSPPNPPRELPRVISRSIDKAGLTPKEIGVTIYHCTGTKKGDEHDWNSARQVFPVPPVPENGQQYPDYPDLPYTILPKASTGHSMAASAGFSVITLFGILNKGEIPPTRNIETPAPDTFNLVHGSAKKIKSEYGLITAVGMDGTVGSMIYETPPREDIIYQR